MPKNFDGPTSRWANSKLRRTFWLWFFFYTYRKVSSITYSIFSVIRAFSTKPRVVKFNIPPSCIFSNYQTAAHRKMIFSRLRFVNLSNWTFQSRNTHTNPHDTTFCVLIGSFGKGVCIKFRVLRPPTAARMPTRAFNFLQTANFLHFWW